MLELAEWSVVTRVWSQETDVLRYPWCRQMRNACEKVHKIDKLADLNILLRFDMEPEQVEGTKGCKDTQVN